MVAHKIAPSIATNNRMVCKPTEKTPLTALLLADVLYEAGLPPEMFQVVTGLPEDIGDVMINHPSIDLITFTGSVRVGKYIAEKAGYRRTVLELGGNSPLIIIEDADHLGMKRQAYLRRMMEKSGKTSRFILVAKSPSRIIDALRSRTRSIRL